MLGYTRAATLDLGVQTGSRFRDLHANASSFSHAAEIGDTNAVRHLLKTKIDPCIKDSTGDTALHGAAFCGRLEVVEILLEAKADANMTDHYGQSAIDMVIQSKRNDWIKCAEALIAAGCDGGKYKQILVEARAREDKNSRKKKSEKQPSIEKNELLSIVHIHNKSDLCIPMVKASAKTTKSGINYVTSLSRMKLLAKKKIRKSVTVKLRRRSSLYARAVEAQSKKKLVEKMAAEKAKQLALLNKKKKPKKRRVNLSKVVHSRPRPLHQLDPTEELWESLLRRGWRRRPTTACHKAPSNSTPSQSSSSRSLNLSQPGHNYFPPPSPEDSVIECDADGAREVSISREKLYRALSLPKDKSQAQIKLEGLPTAQINEWFLRTRDSAPKSNRGRNRKKKKTNLSNLSKHDLKDGGVIDVGEVMGGLVPLGERDMSDEVEMGEGFGDDVVTVWSNRSGK